MRVQIYFRIHEVRVARDITSLSHQENTEDVSNRRIGCKCRTNALADRNVSRLKFRRFRFRGKKV